MFPIQGKWIFLLCHNSGALNQRITKKDELTMSLSNVLGILRQDHSTVTRFQACIRHRYITVSDLFTIILSKHTLYKTKDRQRQ